MKNVFHKIMKRTTNGKRLLSVILALATLITALVVVPIVLPVPETEAAVMMNSENASILHTYYHVFEKADGRLQVPSIGGSLNHVQEATDTNQADVYRTFNSDPWIYYNVSNASHITSSSQNITLKKFPYLAITIAYTETTATFDAQVFFQGSSVGFSETYSARVNVNSNEGPLWKTLIFDLRHIANAYPDDVIQYMRFDPCANIGVFCHVNAFAFFSTPEDAQFFANVKDCQLNGTGVMTFNACNLLADGNTNPQATGNPCLDSNGDGVSDPDGADRDWFRKAHNCMVSLNATEFNQPVLQFTVPNNRLCTLRSNSVGGYQYHADYDNDPNHINGNVPVCTAGFDTGIMFETIRFDMSKYKYLVVVYQTDREDLRETVPKTVVYAKPNGGNQRTEIYSYTPPDWEWISQNFAIFPLNADGNAEYQKKVDIYLRPEGAFYADYQNLENAGLYSEKSITGLRFDPFDANAFTTPGSTLYVRALIFADDEDKARAEVDKYMKDFQVSVSILYDKGAASDIPTMNMPANEIITPGNFNAGYSGDAKYEIPAQIPSRANYTFTGWKNSYNNGIYQPGASTIAPYTWIHDKQMGEGTLTLTAQWAYKYGTWTIGLSQDALNTGQVFLFKISGAPHDSKAGISVSPIYIMLGGTGGKTQETVYLPLGNYTLEPVNQWNWRYTVSNVSKSLTDGSPSGSTTFSMSSFTTKNNKWLNGFSRTST